MQAIYRVYVLQNSDGKFYIGLSEDVAGRLEQHNLGESKWTRGRGPWMIVWQSERLSLTNARRLENRLKRQGMEKVFIRLQAYIGAAHNPAAAGSLVQIQPPQPLPPVSAIYRVYVLQNWKRHTYIGFTENIVLRIQQHNSGMTPSTRGKGPRELIWQSDRLDLADARRLELNLKRQKGGNGFY